jgi:hypothetical protein
MPFVSRAEIDQKVLVASMDTYRQRLRQALLDPALTGDQRQNIKERLTNLGQPKVYREDTPPPPGAIELPVDNEI